MQLDRTHVVIRLRSLSEIGDLALVMIRRYPSALYVGFLFGALPWAIANAALLSWIPVREMAYGFSDAEAASELWRYLVWMTLLVILQAPAAGVLTTVFLGQAVFERQPTWKSVFREVRRQFWKWFLALGVGRMAVPAMAVAALRWGRPADALFDILIPLGLAIGVAVARSSRPFLPEIIMLEQCPFRAKRPGTISISRRVRSLHSPLAGELSGRFVAISAILLFFTLGIFFTLVWFRGIATGIWDQDVLTLTVFYPLALWIVAGFSVLLRLLSYLDTRIRLEGWEVELAIRAEAIRQFGSEAGWIAPTAETPS